MRNFLGVKFVTKNRLNVHCNSHTDISTTEKVNIPKRSTDGIYECTVCESTFNNVSNYRRHFQRTHIRALKKCDECDLSTTDYLDGLKRQKLRKHCPVYPDT